MPESWGQVGHCYTASAMAGPTADENHQIN